MRATLRERKTQFPCTLKPQELSLLRTNQVGLSSRPGYVGPADPASPDGVAAADWRGRTHVEAATTVIPRPRRPEEHARSLRPSQRRQAAACGSGWSGGRRGSPQRSERVQENAPLRGALVHAAPPAACPSGATRPPAPPSGSSRRPSPHGQVSVVRVSSDTDDEEEQKRAPPGEAAPPSFRRPEEPSGGRVRFWPRDRRRWACTLLVVRSGHPSLLAPECWPGRAL
ncbi:unnamed protein product [Rangifer tarandus platyrhynchus]|uniref:Uncharacterized protein n=2 Tax=Rangifer tarandus platyrhynchus TaxID=3082113 RepID=A0ABN8ZDG5_RANTA|nr:unnamed protein product [Rangifer tarandus platyrhynchus]CAI9707638.1 unnamed protein product [Rangifer tarandus platyrhynchus]